MLKQFVEELKKQQLYVAESRLLALTCVYVGLYLPDKRLTAVFLMCGTKISLDDVQNWR